MLADKRACLLLLAVAVAAAEKKPERTDQYGDPLPSGAVARLGTVRWRLPGVVQSCTFSRDGKIVAAAGGDAAIHLFDAETGRPLRQLRRHEANVTCLSFSPDGKMLASGSKDGVLCLWDWPARKLKRGFLAHKEGVRSLAFAGTGKFLASGGTDQRVRLWDPATGRELRQYKGHKEPVMAMAVSPDGRFVASSGQFLFSKVHLWDAASGQILHQHKTGVHGLESLAFSPDSKLLALPVDTVEIGLRDVESGKIVRSFEGAPSNIASGGWSSAMAFSPDGRSVASSARDCSLILWDTATGKIIHQLPGRRDMRPPGGINCLAFSPDGRWLVFGEDHCLRLWNVGAWREVHPLEGHANGIYRILISSDNKTAITAADETVGALQEWDAATGKKRRTLWHKRLIGKNGFQLSPDHKILTIADTQEKSLLLCSQDTTTGKGIRRVALPFNQDGGYSPEMIALSPNGKIITNELWDNSDLSGIVQRDSTTGKEIGKTSDVYYRILFSPDSSILACAESKQIDLHNVSKGRIIWKLPFDDDNHYARSLAFSLNSRIVAVASSRANGFGSDRIDLWETTTGQKRATLFSGPKEGDVLTFSPDGILLASGDSDGVLHLWSLAAGKEVRKLKGHNGSVDSLTFSHDGKSLVSSSSDTTALIWDIREIAAAARPQLADVPRDRLEHLWAELAGNDGVRAQRAIWGLIAARQIMPWLREHLKPTPPGDAKRIAQRIADLDSDTFAVREKATRELEGMGETAESALRKVLASKPTLELRRRVEPIVKNLEKWPASSAENLRDWRALEVLEILGTADARRLLQQLADGVPEFRLTRAAKASLERLAARDAE